MSAKHGEADHLQRVGAVVRTRTCFERNDTDMDVNN